jgi:peptidoglycan/LPS O-acetylase OafA/YrhL
LGIRFLATDFILRHPIFLQLALAVCSISLAIPLGYFIYRFIEEPIIVYVGRNLSLARKSNEA